MRFSVDRARTDRGAVLRVQGELDLATAPVLRSSVEAELAAPPASLVVDLSGTTFLDSAGCRELALGVKAAGRAGTSVVVACPSSNSTVRRVLDFLDMQALVPVVEHAP